MKHESKVSIAIQRELDRLDRIRELESINTELLEALNEIAELATHTPIVHFANTRQAITQIVTEAIRKAEEASNED